MAVDISKVRAAITGAVSKAVTGTAAPTDASTALIAAYKDLGGISEDGVALTLPGDGDKKPIKIWQNGATVRTLRSSSDDLPTVKFTMVETKLETIETYFGVTVTQTATDGSFVYTVQNSAPKVFAVDVIDGAELIRIHIPRGIVTEVGDLVFKNDEPIGYEVTIECELDSTAAYNFKTWMTALKS